MDQAGDCDMHCRVRRRAPGQSHFLVNSRGNRTSATAGAKHVVKMSSRSIKAFAIQLFEFKITNPLRKASFRKAAWNAVAIYSRSGEGIEPSTHRLQVCCSTYLSYPSGENAGVEPCLPVPKTGALTRELHFQSRCLLPRPRYTSVQRTSRRTSIKLVPLRLKGCDCGERANWREWKSVQALF
jgi:hypothetical protein